jgi:predicted porin
MSTSIPAKSLTNSHRQPLNATYIRLDNLSKHNGNGNLYKTGANYALSIRTLLYSDIAHVQNNEERWQNAAQYPFAA